MDIYGKRKRGAYSQKDMDEALDAVKSGISINTASKKFKVPRSTLHSKVINKYATNKPGRDPMLGMKTENNLVIWINKMCALGRPVTKDHLINSVELLLKKSKKKSIFVNGRPGRTWYEAFLRRHKDAKQRIRENAKFYRAVVSLDGIKEWFKDINALLKNENLENLEPKRVFNIGEIMLPLNPRGPTFVKENSDIQKAEENDKKGVSVLITGNAAGQLAPITIVFDSPKISDKIYANLPSGWTAEACEDGCMNAELFYEYIVSRFYPWLVKNKIKLPVILFLDKHVFHLTQILSDFCSNHKIVLIILPPNTSHFMQPMNVSMFSPLRARWSKMVEAYREEYEDSIVSKDDFGPLLQEVFDSMKLSKILRNGFEVCGLHPFSVDNVKYLKFFMTDEPLQSSVNQETMSNDQSTFIQSVEKFIDSSTLETFKSAVNTGKWIGNVEDTSLFYFWKRVLNNHCNESPSGDEQRSDINQNGPSMKSATVQVDSKLTEIRENVQHLSKISEALNDKLLNYSKLSRNLLQSTNLLLKKDVLRKRPFNNAVNVVVVNPTDSTQEDDSDLSVRSFHESDEDL